jgi:DNA-binding MarR family transcriptional regulator
MTGIVDRLVRMKLVERTRSETDRRVVLVRATEDGVKLIQQIQAEIMDEELKMYSALTDNDLTALERLLKQKLRLHAGQYRSLPDEAMDAELERLQRFINDPIQYSKLESEVNP